MSDDYEPVGGAEPPTTGGRRRRRRTAAIREQSQAWIIRGLVLALLHVAVRVSLGVSIDQLPLHSGALRWSSTAVVVIVAVVWGLVDGRRARTDRDLSLVWLWAGVTGGVVAGVACAILAHIDTLGLAANGTLFELTSGAGWTFLLIFLPAVLGMAVGRRSSRRRRQAVSTDVGNSTPRRTQRAMGRFGRGFRDQSKTTTPRTSL